VVLGCGGFRSNVQMRTSTSARWSVRQSARHAAQSGRWFADGDEYRRHAVGQWSGCHATPISADWGEFAPANSPIAATV